ncbi:MAG: methyltransferase domain-containing protein [Nitrospirae bacterium]|nr:MAG: methyltransferase domain-containing protein [Nitrospirota bacterium]
MKNKIIREQFNKQAEKFSEFSFTKSRVIYKFIYDFCRIQPGDTLLDVACGSGAFALFCAEKVRSVCGVDISDRSITMAADTARGRNIQNASFIRSDVEAIPVADGSFSIATCRMAFHHMGNYQKVFSEMVRCVQKNGRICIQDMTACDRKETDDYFEEIDKLVDISHNRSLSKAEIIDLFDGQGVRILNTFESRHEFEINEYASHAIQAPENFEALNRLLETGLNDTALSALLYKKGDQTFLKKDGIVVLGIKE